MPALPAEKVLLLDLRSAFTACFDTRRFLLRCGDYRWRRWRLGFFALRSWSGRWRRGLYRWWLYRRRDWFLLRLLLDYIESSGRNETPAVISKLHKRGLKDLHVARIRIRAVVVILVELVKVTLGRELRRARQYECLVLIGDDHKLAILDRHK